jgi:hypothetical protein
MSFTMSQTYIAPDAVPPILMTNHDALATYAHVYQYGLHGVSSKTRTFVQFLGDCHAKTRTWEIKQSIDQEVERVIL